ncbi:MAG: hypothetical protein K2N63_16600 [Lachnospiraceae bacterium]|nr:hypothetical protein [Lachnospiraceae bacterium]
MGIIQVMRKILDMLNVENGGIRNGSKDLPSIQDVKDKEFEEVISDLNKALDEFGKVYASFINKLFSVHSVLMECFLIREEIVEILLQFDTLEQAKYVASHESYLNQNFYSAHELKLLPNNCVSIITIVQGTWGIKKNFSDIVQKMELAIPKVYKKSDKGDKYKRVSECEVERYSYNINCEKEKSPTHKEPVVLWARVASKRSP